MNRKRDASPAPGAVAAILEGQGAAVGLGDLTAEDKSNSRTAGFGGVERNKQVGRARKARPSVFNPHFEVRTVFPQPTSTRPPVSSAASTAFRNRLMRS